MLLEWLNLYQSLSLTTELVPRAPRSSCRLSRRTSTSDPAALSRPSSFRTIDEKIPSTSIKIPVTSFISSCVTC